MKEKQVIDLYGIRINKPKFSQWQQVKNYCKELFFSYHKWNLGLAICILFLPRRVLGNRNNYLVGSGIQKFSCILICTQFIALKIFNLLKVLACLTGCFGQDDEAACQFICQWELGQANEKYLNLLKCMAEHGCLSMQPDGICLGDSRCDFVLL